MAPREGGARLGYTKYNEDSETSSESEQEESLIDETESSIRSFTSNGERVWRSPDGVFSKREQKRRENERVESRRIKNTPVPVSPLHLRADSPGGISNRNVTDDSSVEPPTSCRSSSVPRLDFGQILKPRPRITETIKFCC